MAINVSQAFHRTSANPVDDTLTLTKAEMLTINDNLMPSKYLTVCQDDGFIYLYDKSATASPTTGKFTKFEGGGSGSSALADLTDVDLASLAEGQILVWDDTNSKWVNEDFPTIPSATSDLTNDSGFITNAVNDLISYYLKTETYSKTEVDDIVTAIKNSRFEAVNTLPTTDIKTNVIYLVPSSDPQTENAKDEYINLDGTTAGWELIGSTAIDLSGYVTTSDLNTALADYTTTSNLTTLLAAKQDVIQVSSMPTAGADNAGDVLQFIGTTGTYTHGYFYECVEDSGSYSWVQTNVQPTPSGVSALDDLSDVSLTTPTSGQVLKYDGTGWVNDDESSSVAALDDIGDVNLTSPTDGQVLKYDATNDEWINADESGGGGGDAELSADVTSNLAVGAIASGTTLTEGTTFTEFVQKLLITEIAPTIAFSISKNGNVAYGGSYTETLTVNVSAMGSAKKINSIAWYEGSTLKKTDTIDSTVTGSWTYTMDTATTDTTTFKAIVTYTKSNDATETVTKTASINFYYNKFYGSVSSLTPDEATVEALTSTLATAKGGTYSFTVSAGRICYAYPKSLGTLSNIKDGNGFSLFDSFTRTEQTYTQNGTSVAYYRYVLTDATTVSGYSVIFA